MVQIEIYEVNPNFFMLSYISDEFEFFDNWCGDNDGWFCISYIFLVCCIHFIQAKKWDS